MVTKIITIILTIILLTIIPKAVADAEVKRKNNVYYQIIKNHPKIDRQYAVELSEIIQRIADEYKVQSRKLAAILAQESMYRLDPKKCLNKPCTDYGISQIHYKTIKAYKFDKKRLITDLEYSIAAGAKVLADFKKSYGKKEKDFWTRYNASSPEKREEYKKLVQRYM